MIRLTQEQITEAKRLYTEDGWGSTLIARKFNVNRCYIIKLVQGLTKADKIVQTQLKKIPSHYRQFTIEQESQISSLRKEGKSYIEIGKLFGCNEKPIKRILLKNNIHTNNSNLKQVQLDITDVYSTNQLAKKYNIQFSTAKRLLKEQNLKIPNRIHREKSVPESEHQNIVNLYTKENISSYIIAQKYDCSYNTIVRILELYNISRDNTYYIHISRKELSYKEYIESLGFKTEKFTFPDRTEIDIYLPEQKIGFEFNGLIWHSIKYHKKHRTSHIDKTELCLKNGIKLYHIWENDNEAITKNKIRQILKKDITKIYARKCEIKRINTDESRCFLSQYHLHGYSNGNICYGLYYNNELVSTIAMIKKEDYYEINRFCTKELITVIGGFKKLLTHFIKDYSPTKITTYSYRDWCPDYKDSIYHKQGFTFEKYTEPSLWFTDGNKKVNRHTLMKHKLLKKYPDLSYNMTGKECAKKIGFYQIYDSGNAKFSLIINKLT